MIFVCCYLNLKLFEKYSILYSVDVENYICNNFQQYCGFEKENVDNLLIIGL